MTDRRPTRADAISEQDAARLLARASELDAAYRTLPELRAAAAEAGISSRAFDAALEELREENVKSSPPPTTGRRFRRLTPFVASMVLLGFIALVGVSRMVVPSAAPSAIAVPMMTEAFLLNCLSPGEAAALVRPILSHPSNQVVASPANAPRVITVLGTRDQLAQVRTVLEAQGAAACTNVPAPAATR